MLKTLYAALLLCLSASALSGERVAIIAPDATPNGDVPHMLDVTGFDFGHKVATHGEIMAYSRALAAASSRVHLQVRGKTWQDREMGLLFVSSEANIAKLEDFQKRYQAIADPRKTNDAAFKEAAEGLPVLVWLQQSVHGDEISGSDSGIYLAWMLAALNTDAVKTVLDQSILVVELMQNPDGRDRFIAYSRDNRAPTYGDPDPQAAERSQPWPGGRLNHYNFDMNRDWISMSQPETHAKVDSILEWFPQVTVDLHEMGSESSFFAAAPSPPANPLLSQRTLDAYVDFGKAIGRAFDAVGEDYFHTEIFDSFYPGYGEAWPSLQGAVGVLFEQGSARGLAYQRRSGEILTHRQAVDNQTRGSYAVLTHAAAKRAEMLRFLYDNRKEAMTLDDNKAVFLMSDDANRLAALGQLLRDQGIEVTRLTEDYAAKALLDPLDQSEDASASKGTVPNGSLMVRLDQPAGRLARTVLYPEFPMGDDFTERQLQRVTDHEGAEIYDVTAWSLALMFGVDMKLTTATVKVGDSEDLSVAGGLATPDATVGFLVPVNFNQGRFLADALKCGLVVHFTTEAMEHEGRTYPAGSLVFKRKPNPDDLADHLAEMAKTWGQDVTGVNTSWMAKGPAFGSDKVRQVLKPRVAMLWGEGTSPMSAGWMRYLMEQRLHYPVTALRADRIGGYDLSKYNVILMPAGWGYRFSADKIKDWVAGGGILVAVDNAVDWLMRDNVGLLNAVAEDGNGAPRGSDSPAPPNTLEEDPRDMIEPLGKRAPRSYGQLIKVDFDSDQWPAYGMSDNQYVVVSGSRILRPLRLDEGRNIGRYSDAPALGFGPGTEQRHYKAHTLVTRHGRGLVVSISEDPNYRAYLRGMEPLMANAILMGYGLTR